MIDMSQFYEQAAAKGYTNNMSYERMIAPLLKTQPSNFWVLYYNDIIVATVGAHLIKDNVYRIGVRACVLPHQSDLYKNTNYKSWLTAQTVPLQFLLPACIEWVGRDNRMYITTHTEHYGKHKSADNVTRLVARKTGIFKFEKEMVYRKTKQSFWRVDCDALDRLINENQKWDCAKENGHKVAVS